MNRTYLEDAVKRLTEVRGYTYFAAPDDAMPQTINIYPAAWLSPLVVQERKGITHGICRYGITLRLLRPGARLSHQARNQALSEMECALSEILAALPDEPCVLDVQQLSIKPSAFSLTPHGELAQCATAQIITFF